MANEDIEQKIKLTYETNAEEAAKQTDDLVKATDDVTASKQNSTKATRLNTEAIKEVAPAATSAIESFKSMGKAMWALVANPLGAVLAAIVVTVGLLVAVFRTFQPIVDKVEQGMAALGAVINVIKNTFVALVTGAKSLGEAFSGLGGEMSDAATETIALTKAQQDLEDVMKSQEVTTARNRAEINKLNVALRNRTLSETERLKISDQIVEKEKADFEQRKALVDEEIRIARKAIAIKAQFTKEEEDLLKRTGDATKDLAESRGGNYDEEYEALNKARIKAIALEDENTVALEKQYARRDKLEDDRQAKIDKANAERKAKDEKARAERQKQLEKEAQAEKARQDLINEGLKAEQDALKKNQDLNDVTEEEKLARQKERDLADIERLKQKGIDVRNLLVYNNELYNKLEDDLRKKREEEKLQADLDFFAKESDAAVKRDQDQAAIDKAAFEQKQAIKDAEMGLLYSGLSLAKDIFEKNKKVQKAVLLAENGIALAKLTLNTIQAISADNAASPLTLGAPWSVIHAAQGVIGAASIISSTNKGLKALGGGSASGGTTNYNTGGSGGQRSESSTPQVSFQASSENQIANTIANNTNSQEPIKVFVTESDITNKQGEVKAAVTANSF